MMEHIASSQAKIEMISIESIDILNSRERNRKAFEEIIDNIKTIGLKKPIVVTPRQILDQERYLLVCGEGRLKAFQALGHKSIPALVINVDDESAFIMSLAENIARRKVSSIELLSGIDQLLKNGLDAKSIATKTGLSSDYIYGIALLLKKGERRLLVGVNSGRIPLTIAIAIAKSGNDDIAIQEVLQDAYESGQLRGRQLHQARKIIDQRRMLGFDSKNKPYKKNEQQSLTASSLVRSYRHEVERQQSIIRKSENAQRNLVFIVGALKQLFDDENFTTLLRAEGLDTLPKYLADRVWPHRSHI